jgi:imidazolonepropionase-like amidohydrolase
METEYTRRGTEVQARGVIGRATLLTLFVSAPIVTAPGGADTEKGLREAVRGQPVVTAFVDVNVVPLDTERVLEGSTVIVEGDRIVTIGPADSVTLPEGAIVIDGSGGYLMPGLADMHFHADGRPEAFMLAVAYGVTTVRNLNARRRDLDVTRRIADGELIGPSVYNGPSLGGVPPGLMPLVWAYRFLLGVGFALAALVVVRIISRAVHRRAAPSWRRARVPIGIGLLLTGVAAAGLGVPSSEPLIGVVAGDRTTLSPERAREIVLDHGAIGADFIKVNQFLRRDVFDAIVSAAAVAGLPVIGHVSGDVGLEHHLAAGVEIQHTTEIAPYLSRNERYDDPRQMFDLLEANTKIARAVELVREAGVAFTPTLGLYDYIDTHLEADRFYELMGRPEVRLMPPSFTHDWHDASRNPVLRRFDPADRLYVARYLDVQNELVLESSRAGVPILAGTDVTAIPGPVWGESLHRELELLVGAGLTPYQALAAATWVPAGVMGELEHWGTIRSGMQADLVLLTGNPLENISHTRDRVGVMLRGTWYPQSELQQVLDQVEASYAVEN